MKKGLIFDLDGVLVDTAKYHYLAWRILADELGIPFSQEQNERLKGVGRRESFEILLDIGARKLNEQEKDSYCEKKNQIYRSYIGRLKEEEVLPGVRPFLMEARELRYPVALGSASKNASFILDRLKLLELFDAVIDGTKVSRAKPDPEVFLKGAQELGLAGRDCIVFEDSEAGIEAAHRAGMSAVGVGSRDKLPKADCIITGFENLHIAMLEEMLKREQL